MPAVAIIPWAIAAAATATTAYATVESKKASDSAASTAVQVAQYNQKLDQAQSDQLDFDTQANIDSMRRDAATYMSRQASAYAGSGIVANSGSALAVQATTAGREAMREQQTWTDSQAKEQQLASAGQAGIAEGESQADADHYAGIAAVMNGAGKIAGQVGGDYQDGLFGSPGSNTNTDVDPVGG